MKKKYQFCLSLTLGLLIFLLAMSGLRRKEEALASRIAPEILRFHVLANSDSAADQTLKLEVKDFILDKLQTGLETEEAASKEVICHYITVHKSALETAAEYYIKEQGFDYKVRVELAQCLFPEKTYGDMTFPAGTYDAVRVLIGQGKGKNFWCVLYPSLCYLDSTYAIVPESSKNQLSALLSEDDFQALLNARPVKIRFKLADWLKMK